MHDPTSIFRFEEHDVYLPMVVLEELDAHKKGLSEASRNVRQVSRFPRRHDPRRDQRTHRSWTAIAERVFRQSWQEAFHGTAVLPDTPALERAAGESARPSQRQRHTRANARVAEREAGCAGHPGSKDINLRIKAAVLGVHAEDYYSDKTAGGHRRPLQRDDSLTRRLLGTANSKDMRSWKEGDRTFYELSGPAVQQWQPNQGVYEDTPDGIEGMVPQNLRRESDSRAATATTAASATSLGQSPRAIASRTSRSIS